MDSSWAVFAGRVRGMLRRHARLRNRITGAIYVAAGLGLAAARKAT